MKKRVLAVVLMILFCVTSITFFTISLVQYIPSLREWKQETNEYNKIVKDYDNGNGFLIGNDGRITYCTVYGLTQTSTMNFLAQCIKATERRLPYQAKILPQYPKNI